MPVNVWGRAQQPSYIPGHLEWFRIGRDERLDLSFATPVKLRHRSASSRVRATRKTCSARAALGAGQKPTQSLIWHCGRDPVTGFCFTVNQRFLARIGDVAVDASLLAMQQLRQRVLVMQVGWREHRAVGQTARSGVHADMQLCTEVGLLALADLVHPGGARLLLILRRARRADGRGDHSVTTRELHSPGLKQPAGLGKQLHAAVCRSPADAGT